MSPLNNCGVCGKWHQSAKLWDSSSSPYIAFFMFYSALPTWQLVCYRHAMELWSKCAQVFSNIILTLNGRNIIFYGGVKDVIQTVK